MLKNNILANLAGNSITAVVFLICIPVYVKQLGVESYGLIGFFASLQVVFSVLDAGLSATLNREFARLSVSPEGRMEQRNLLKTFEGIYFFIAIFIGLAIFLLSPFISKHWLSTVTISQETIHIVLIQMGALLALRWPTSLYWGGLTGLQKQVLYNLVYSCGELVKAVGAIFILIFVSNSIITFFYWQIIITGIVVLTLRFIIWKQLPLALNSAKFSKTLLKKNRSFAMGMGATTLTAIVLTQTDKIILSKILNLQNFGYYTLAYTIASSLSKITMPVSQAIYPRLVQLVHSNEYEKLVKLFHTACQLIACLILPFVLTIIFFAKEIVTLWTRNEALAQAVFPLVRIFIIGTACNALIIIPYMAQLAYGWAKLGLYQNITGILFLIPGIIYLTHQYGVLGAVWVPSIINIAYIMVSMPVMFKKILKDEKWRWYRNDILMILLPALITMVLLRLIFNHLQLQNTFFIICYCTIATSILLVLAIFSATHMRQNISVLRKKFLAIKIIKQ